MNQKKRIFRILPLFLLATLLFPTKGQILWNGEEILALGAEGARARVLERLLEDPEKLAGDLDALTRALQRLSDDLRRSAADGRKEDDR